MPASRRNRARRGFDSAVASGFAEGKGFKIRHPRLCLRRLPAFFGFKDSFFPDFGQSQVPTLAINLWGWFQLTKPGRPPTRFHGFGIAPAGGLTRPSFGTDSWLRLDFPGIWV